MAQKSELSQIVTSSGLTKFEINVLIGIVMFLFSCETKENPNSAIIQFVTRLNAEKKLLQPFDISNFVAQQS